MDMRRCCTRSGRHNRMQQRQTAALAYSRTCGAVARMPLLRTGKSTIHGSGRRRAVQLHATASLQTAQLAAATASHAHIPFEVTPVTAVADEQQQSSSSSSGSGRRTWFGRRPQNEQSVEPAAAPVLQLQPQQLLQMQQRLLQQQQQQRGTSPLLVAVPVVLLVAGVAAGAAQVWQARQGQQQQQQQLPQLLHATSPLHSHANQLASSAQNILHKLAAAAARAVKRPSAAVATAQPAVSSSNNSTTQQQQQQQLPQGWWLSLEKVYYLNFGAYAGLLPRVELPSRTLQNPSQVFDQQTGSTFATSGAKQQHLIAFESSADAAYVCNVLQSSYVASAVADGKSTAEDAKQVFRGVVVSAKPWYLEDMAAVQNVGLEVLPQGRLRYDEAITGMQILELLGQLLTGVVEPQQQQQQGLQDEQQQQQQEPAAVQPGSITDPEETAAATATLNTGSSSSSSSSSSFRPITTDLPLFDFHDEMFGDRLAVQSPTGQSYVMDALQNVMAAGVAAVPLPVPGRSSSSRQGGLQQQQQQQQPRLAENLEAGSSSSSRVQNAEPQQQQQRLQGAVSKMDISTESSSSSRPQLAAHAAAPVAVEADILADGSELSQNAAAAAAAVDVNVTDGQSQTYGSYVDTHYEDDDLDDSVIAELLAEYQQLKQQQPQVAEEIEAVAAAAAAVAAAAAGEDAPVGTASPTDIAAAAAADGIAVEMDDLADAVAAKFFKSSSSGSSSRAERDPPRAAAAAVAAESSIRKPSTTTAAAAAGGGGGGDVLGSMQQQLQQLHQQAEAVLQQQQQGQSSAAATGLDLQLQQLLQGIANVQQQMQQVATATDVPLKQPDSNRVERSTGAVQAVKPGSSNNSSRRSGLWSAPVIEANIVTSANSSSSSSANTAPAPAPGQSQPDANSTSSAPGSSNSSSGKRAWGAWSTNKRTRASNATPMKDSNALERNGRLDSAQQQQQQWGSGTSSSSSNDAATHGKPAVAVTAAAAAQADDAMNSNPQQIAASRLDGEADAVVTDDGATIFSRKLGVNRPKKVSRDPLERQMLVKDALRVAAEQMAGEAEGSSNGFGSSSSSDGKQQWWQERYQAVFLPTIRYPDGSVGFVQLDVSLNPAVKDVRVLTFEDRHECMKCLTVMRQWPQMQAAQLTMGAMQSSMVEQQIRDAYSQQLAAAGGDSSAVGVSLPSGIVVFRKGKLAMRVGMDEAEFTELVVYQAAAQLALSNMGYRFDDA